MSTTTPAPAALPHPLEKHLATLVNCAQNVIYFIMLVHFLESCMFVPCFATRVVSPVESWTGLFYNMWFSVLVFGMMMAFKDTLEALLLFENSKRHREGKKDATTTITACKEGAKIEHFDNGSTSTEWRTIACYILQRFLNKDDEKSETEEKEASKDDAKSETEEQEATKKSENDTKPAATSAEDEIKPDTASASSSARSSADTSDARD
jgi:hypothetical protein